MATSDNEWGALPGRRPTPVDDDVVCVKGGSNTRYVQPSFCGIPIEQLGTVRRVVDSLEPHRIYAGPVHKTCGQPIECIDVVETMGFSIGNVIKYCWRSDRKGSRLEQLQKAAWYLQREIENEQQR